MLLGRHTRSVFFEALPALTSCLAIMHIFRSKFAGPSLDICYTTRYGAFGHRFPCSSAVCFQAFTLRHSLLRQRRKTCGLISRCTEQDTALQPSVGRGWWESLHPELPLLERRGEGMWAQCRRDREALLL